jgi:hypothetical protein
VEQQRSSSRDYKEQQQRGAAEEQQQRGGGAAAERRMRLQRLRKVTFQNVKCNLKSTMIHGRLSPFPPKGYEVTFFYTLYIRNI